MSAEDTPHSDEAERAALGSVLIKPSALSELGPLDADDFFQPVHRDILDAMRAVAKRGQPVEVVLVWEELKAQGLHGKLKDGMMYLSSTLMDSVSTAENVRHYAEVVRDRATRRRVIAACGELMSSARGDVDAMELISEARSKFAAIELRGRSATRSIGGELDGVAERMERRGVASTQPRSTTVTTGISRLDRLIGPLRPDNLIAIGANPGRGKSALALNIAIRNAKRFVPVLVFSMEMSRDQLIERAIAFDCRINSRKLTLGVLTAEEWTRVNRSALSTLPLWINDERMTIGKLQGEVRSWRARRRIERLSSGLPPDEAELALVVVDYLQLIDTDGGDETKRYQAVGKISRELKLLTKERDANLPLIECVQLNRENLKGSKDGKAREPHASDMRESGNIEQDADTILFPWWEGEPPHVGRHPATILVRKQRSGVQGRAPCDWEPEFTTFSDRIEEDDPRLPPEPERDTR